MSRRKLDEIAEKEGYAQEFHSLTVKELDAKDEERRTFATRTKDVLKNIDATLETIYREAKKVDFLWFSVKVDMARANLETALDFLKKESH